MKKKLLPIILAVLMLVTVGTMWACKDDGGATPGSEVKITLDKTTVMLDLNAVDTITATTENYDGNVTFISANREVATVRVSGKSCTITGKSAGTTTVTAKAGETEIVCNVTVKQIDGLAFSKTIMVVEDNLTETTLDAAVYEVELEYTKKDSAATVALNTGDSKIATVAIKEGSDTGKKLTAVVTPIAAGETAITATINEETTTCALEVYTTGLAFTANNTATAYAVSADPTFGAYGATIKIPSVYYNKDTNNYLPVSSIPEDGFRVSTASAAQLGAVTKVIIGKNVHTIGKKAFAANDFAVGSLAQVEFLGNSLTTVGVAAFQNTKATTLVFPDSVTLYDEAAFQGMKNLVSIDLGEKAEKLKFYAFLDCDALQSIYFPATISEVGKDVFLTNGTSSLATVYYGGTPETFTAFHTMFTYTNANSKNPKWENLDFTTVWYNATGLETGEQVLTGKVFIGLEKNDIDITGFGATATIKVRSSNVPNGQLVVESSDSNVATAAFVNGVITVTAKNGGSAIITATYNDVEVSCIVTVTAVQSLTVNKTETYIENSKTDSSTAELYSFDINFVKDDIGQEISVTSSSAIIALTKGEQTANKVSYTINPAGGVGFAIITVTLNGETKTIAVEVYSSGLQFTKDGDTYKVAKSDVGTIGETLYIPSKAADDVGFTAVTKIADSAFADLLDIKNVSIGANVTEIGANAFKNSTAAFSFNNKLTTIGASAFEGATINQILLPDSVLTIGDYAFKNMANLTIIGLGTKVTTIGAGILQNTNVVTIFLPKTITTVDTAIGMTAGATGESIYTDIHFGGTYEQYNTVMALFTAADECAQFKDINKKEVYYNATRTDNGTQDMINTDLVTVTLDKPTVEITGSGVADTVTITVEGFAGTLTVTEDSNKQVIVISVTNKVISITSVHGGTATITVTAGDKSATCTVTVSGVTDTMEFDRTAAYIANNQELAKIPDAYYVFKVQKLAKADTNSLLVVTSSDETILKIEQVSNDGGTINFKYLPQGGVGKVNITAKLNSLEIILPIEVYNAELVFTSKAAVNGEWVVEVFDIVAQTTAVPEHVFIPAQVWDADVVYAKVTAIDDGAFRVDNDETKKAIKKITFGDNITSVGRKFVAGSNAELVFNNKLTTIEKEAFSASLYTSLVLPDSVTTLGVSAFAKMANLTSIDLGNGLTTIGNQAFIECHVLEKIYLPKTIQTVGTSAFGFYSATTEGAYNEIRFGGTAAEFETIRLLIVGSTSGNAAPYFTNPTNVYYNATNLTDGALPEVVNP